jgi:Zn-dependent peptidase ImmA (M78 family)
MISKIRRLEVVRNAEEAAKGFESLPVDPIAIAKAKDIIVQSWNTTKQGVSGFLMKKGDAFGIGYSAFIKNPGFVNFTVGHELGHYHLDGHVDKLFPEGSSFHESRSGFLSSNECEREADLFSATLLMPEALFRKAQRSAGEGFPAIESLATLCVTSITATAIRFAEFAEGPVAVIVGSGGTVDFCFMSDVIRDHRDITWLKAGDSIPGGTCTARFHANPESIASGRKAGGFTTLDEWFEGAPRLEMKEDVVGLGHYGKTLTVLFTREALEDSDGEEEDDGYVPSWRRTR